MIIISEFATWVDTKGRRKIKKSHHLPCHIEAVRLIWYKELGEN